MTVQSKPIDFGPTTRMILETKSEMKNPMPTPPVGFTVIWYARAMVGKDNQVAAIVTKVEGPSRITVTTFRPQGVPDPTKRGCLHVSNPVHQRRSNSVSVNSGAWDYVSGTKIPKEHYEVHLDQLRKKQQDLESKIAEAEAVQIKQDEKSSSLDGLDDI